MGESAAGGPGRYRLGLKLRVRPSEIGADPREGGTEAQSRLGSRSGSAPRLGGYQLRMPRVWLVRALGSVVVVEALSTSISCGVCQLRCLPAGSIAPGG
jgi:hypothetical protein